MMLSVHHAKTEKNPESQTAHLLRLHLHAVGPRLSVAWGAGVHVHVWESFADFHVPRATRDQAGSEP